VVAEATQSFGQVVVRQIVSSQPTDSILELWSLPPTTTVHPAIPRARFSVESGTEPTPWGPGGLKAAVFRAQLVGVGGGGGPGGAAGRAAQ
jgi:hypothetical protein